LISSPSGVPISVNFFPEVKESSELRIVVRTYIVESVEQYQHPCLICWKFAFYKSENFLPFGRNSGDTMKSTS